MANVEVNKLKLGNGATPFTVADAVIRECPDKEWLEDVVFYINAYIERTYPSNVRAESEVKWIPVSGIEELPKKALWVTRKGADYAYVELIGWDSQRNCRTEDGGFRCDSDLKDVVAYMPYSEPEPY